MVLEASRNRGDYFNSRQIGYAVLNQTIGVSLALLRRLDNPLGKQSARRGRTAVFRKRASRRLEPGPGIVECRRENRVRSGEMCSCSMREAKGIDPSLDCALQSLHQTETLPKVLERDSR
jgi:hypothetical protein